MISIIKKIYSVRAIILIIILSLSCDIFANVNILNNGITNTYNQYNPNYYPNYNPNYNPNYYPNYNPYAIPNNSYYYIIGYDRPVTTTYNGMPMNTRVPILSGNYPYYVNIANGLIYNSYVSISKWCNENLFTSGVQDFYLNFASIESEAPNEIVMVVNCAIKKNGVINSNIDFRLILNIATNRFRWRKNSNNGFKEYEYRVYEYDSESGDIIIIR